MTNIQALARISASLSPTALALPHGLPFEEWEEIGTALQSAEKSVRWWIGDWLAYGERSYGESYSQAVETTGRSYQDLADMAYVSGAIEFSDRSENLSWSHHRAVASLAPEARREWLAAAEEHDWSKRELADQIKQKRADVSPKIPVCKRCGVACKVCRAEIGEVNGNS